MSKQYEWNRWIKMNNKLWEDSTKIGKGGTNLNNVKAFMSYILGKQVRNPMDIETIKAFNQKLGNEKMQLEGSSLKYNSEERVFNDGELSKYSLNFLTSKKQDKYHKQLYYLKAPEASKNKMISIDGNSLTMETSIIQNFIDSKQEIIDKYNKIFDKELAKKLGIVSFSLNGFVINVFLANTQAGLTDTFQLSKKNDLIKKMWLNSYYPYVDEEINSEVNNFDEDMKEIIRKKIEEDNPNSLEEDIDKLLNKAINKKALSNLTFKWFKSNKDNIKQILKKINFYKNNSNRQEDFLNFFMDTIEKQELSYYNSEGKYLESFGGDFGEIDTLVRPASIIKEREINQNVQILILGKTLAESSKKQIPADGELTFNYNKKDYTVTFQSKLFSMSGYASGIYTNANFLLGNNKEKIDNNQHKTNLYAYPGDMLTSWGYQTVQKAINDNQEGVDNEKNYLGALPGLLRIRTFVSEVEKLNKSDFYYFSGYYIPSYFLLTKIKEYLDKPNSWPYKNRPLKVEINDNLVYGTVGVFNIYNFLSNIIQR